MPDQRSTRCRPKDCEKLTSHLARSGPGLVLWLILAASYTAGAPQQVILRGSAVDEAGKPVEGLEVVIQSPSGETQIGHTDIAGAFEFQTPIAGEYHLSFNKSGFFRITGQKILLDAGVNEASFTVFHETEIHQEVEVYSSSEDIQPLVTTHSDSLVAREIRDIPVSSTHDLKSSLQVLPEVVRDRSGQLHVSGGRTEETQYLLDGFDIGDPSTGNLSLGINVDSVRDVEAASSRYGAQYGNAGAGVLGLNTATGDDRWRAGATNFFPGISAERGLHLTSWYPRLTLSGPLRKERAWFYETLSVQHTLSLVHELPPDEDSVSQWAGDNMLRTQVKLNPKNMLQGNFLYNQRKASNLGLGPFAPASTTRGLRAYRSFYSVKDQIWSGRTFYELGMAADFSHSESLPHGFEPYILTPDGAAGNYFETLRQKASRWQGTGSVSMPARRWHGTHDLQFGFHASETAWEQSAERGAIEVLRADETLSQSTSFYGPGKFKLTDTRLGIYGNDIWRIVKPLVLQAGMRIDWDGILHRATPSPRISLNYLPFENDRTKFTASWGVFLQPAMLSKFGPAYDQMRLDTFYSPGGLQPVFGPVTSRFELPQHHLEQPRFYTFSLGGEQKIGNNSYAEINFTRRHGGFGLAYERAVPDPAESLYMLQNNRRDYYRSVKISFRHAFSDKSSISFSYTRSEARTNQVYEYSLSTPVFVPQEPGPLDWDAPNRFVSWGWAPAPWWGLLLSYFFEYRTGFPFSVVDERQQPAGPANGERFPDYAILNFGIEKRIHLFRREWAIRLTILNVTSHANPDGVINNVDSSDFMKFSGGQKLSLTARIRLVG